MSTRYKYWYLLVVGFEGVDGVGMGTSTLDVGFDAVDGVEMASSRLDDLAAATVAKIDSFVADMMST